MVSQLTNKDYVSILKYYNLDIPRSKTSIKLRAENILAEKLCRCIKKVDNDESKSIPICSKSIFTNKGYKLQKIQCKKTKSIKISKITKKTRKHRSKK